MISRQTISEEQIPVLGMNPVTLAIALVVITIVIAAGLSFWASGIGNREPEKTDCSIADFSLYSGTYDPSKSSMFLVLENLQPTELKHLTLYVFYPDNIIVEKPMKENLGASKIKSYDFTEISEDFEKGVIKTNCPDVTIEFARENGTLKEIKPS